MSNLSKLLIVASALAILTGCPAGGDPDSTDDSVQPLSKGSTDSTQSSKDRNKKEGEVLILRGHHLAVTSVTFSPDGLYALTGSFDNTAKLWSIPNGMCIKTLSGHGGNYLSSV